MATSPVPLWAQEMRADHRGPTGANVLMVAIVTVALVLLLTAGAATDRGGAGRRVLSPACAEAARLRAHRVTSGSSYRRAATARKEASSGQP